MPFALLGLRLNLMTGADLSHRPSRAIRAQPRLVVEGRVSGAGRVQRRDLRMTVGPRVAALGPGDATPMAARCIGAISLCAWLGVLYWGRMLPFIGNAY